MVNPAPFGWPDMFLQPGHQGFVVGHTTEQRHGGVTVGVNITRQQHLVGQVNGLGGLAGAGGGVFHRQNTAVVHKHRLVFQHLTTGGRHGEYPTGVNTQISRHGSYFCMTFKCAAL